MIGEWLKHIQRIHKQDEIIIKNGSKFFVPFVAIPTPIVKTVFMIVQKFHLSLKTKYLALRIYDHFMCYQFWDLFVEYGNNPYSIEYKQATDRISALARLRLMSCIQLASKMDSNSSGLGISQVIYALKLMDSLANQRDTDYTAASIFHSEFKVFKTISFKIPIVTPVDSIEVLLAALNLHQMPKLYDTAMTILDFTYLQHQQLYCQLQFMITGAMAKTKAEKLNEMMMESDLLFLSSGIILCSLFIFNVDETVLHDKKIQLSTLVKIEDADIITIARVIFSMINLPEITKI